ncbi:class F sortase [Arthrobacter sp. TMS1-12-1]
MEQARTPEPAAEQRPETSPIDQPRGPRSRPWLALPFVAAAVAVAVSLSPSDSSGVPSSAPSPSSTLSAAATPSPVAVPATVAPAAPAVATGPVASQPRALSFPAAGIEMAVLPLTPSDADLAAQALVPPLTVDAYWLTSYGIPGGGSSNTTYIAGHSWDGRDAPFNALSDETLVGTEFTLTVETGDLTYVVDSVTTHDKDTLKDSDIWNIVPNRVVLISCYTEDPWGKNVVVTAMPKAA